MLAVALTESACTAENSWALLDAGASDVFAWHDALVSAEVVAARLERWAEVDAIATSEQVQKLLSRSSSPAKAGPAKSWQRA